MPAKRNDPRITEAKKVLKDGLAEGERLERRAPNRATGTRAKYKSGLRAAEGALAVLSAPR